MTAQKQKQQEKQVSNIANTQRARLITMIDGRNTNGNNNTDLDAKCDEINLNLNERDSKRQDLRFHANQIENIYYFLKFVKQF